MVSPLRFTANLYYLLKVSSLVEEEFPEDLQRLSVLAKARGAAKSQNSPRRSLVSPLGEREIFEIVYYRQSRCHESSKMLQD